jgi:hypothetical protein
MLQVDCLSEWRKNQRIPALYERIFLDYTYGLEKIYTTEEIERAKQSPSFEREYSLKYLDRIGNTFLPSDIDKALSPLLSSSNNSSASSSSLISNIIDPDQFTLGARKSMGIDPAWGSSAFGIVITNQIRDDKVQILYMPTNLSVLILTRWSRKYGSFI